MGLRPVVGGRARSEGESTSDVAATWVDKANMQFTADSSAYDQTPARSLITTCWLHVQINLHAQHRVIRLFDGLPPAKHFNHPRHFGVAQTSSTATPAATCLSMGSQRSASIWRAGLLQLPATGVETGGTRGVYYTGAAADRRRHDGAG